MTVRTTRARSLRARKVSPAASPSRPQSFGAADRQNSNRRVEEETEHADGERSLQAAHGCQDDAGIEKVRDQEDNPAPSNKPIRETRQDQGRDDVQHGAHAKGEPRGHPFLCDKPEDRGQEESPEGVEAVGWSHAIECDPQTVSYVAGDDQVVERIIRDQALQQERSRLSDEQEAARQPELRTPAMSIDSASEPQVGSQSPNEAMGF